MPKYKFSRAKWYEFRLSENNDFWNPSGGYNKLINWCNEQFGEKPEHPDAWSRWYPYTSGVIRFRDEKDYMLCALRWS